MKRIFSRMLSNILFRFSADGNRGAAFSAEVLRKGIADRSNCHNDAVRSRRRRTDDDRCSNGRGACSRQ